MILAFDLGSSSVRAVVFDPEPSRAPLAAARRPVALRQDSRGAAEIDPDAYVDAVAECLDELAAAGHLRGVDVVAASSQWHSLIPLDPAGRPAGPALSWLDVRPAAPPGLAPADAAAFHDRTGAWWHPLYWPVRIRWLRDNGVAAHRWLGLPEYLYARLLGVDAASVSSASGTGALDTRTCVWDPEALDLAGVAAEALPELLPDGWAGRLRPEHRRRWPDLGDAGWAPPLGDGAASSVGSGCDGPDRLAITVGTSAAVRLVVPAPRPGEALPEALWRYRVDGSRAILGVGISGGGTLRDWVSRLLGPAAVTEESLAARAPGEHGLVVLPYHAGHRPPHPVTGGGGAIRGLRLSTTPADVAAATLEGLCHELARSAGEFDAYAPAEYVLGGGLVAGSAWFSRRLAAALGGRAVRSTEPEVGARGAALAAVGAVAATAAEDVYAEPAEVAAMRLAARRQDELRARLDPLGYST